MKELIVKLSGIFGFDLFVYHEVIYREQAFIFRSKRKYYLALRIFLYIVILMMALSFLILFAILQNHQNILIPIETPDGLTFTSAKEDVLRTNWLHLLFGIIYLLMVYKTFTWMFNVYKARKGKLSSRRKKRKGITYANVDNILYSFDYAFMWYIIIICIIRLSLDFTIGHYQVIMNPGNHALAVQENIDVLGSAYWFHAVYVLYYILIITTCSLVIIYIFGYLIKPELKEQYIKEIKQESIFYITKEKAREKIQEKIMSENGDESDTNQGN